MMRRLGDYENKSFILSVPYIGYNGLALNNQKFKQLSVYDCMRVRTKLPVRKTDRYIDSFKNYKKYKEQPQRIIEMNSKYKAKSNY